VCECVCVCVCIYIYIYIHIYIYTNLYRVNLIDNAQVHSGLDGGWQMVLEKGIQLSYI
jgi:hypothetical protein